MKFEPIQKQAKALGDPTRHRIFRCLADADGAVGVGELTDHVGLNHNAIRQVAKGLADQFEGVEGESIEPHDPMRAVCHLRFSLESEDTGELV